MATYILLATYTEQGIKGIKDTVKRTDAVKELAKKAGLTMKESYWTLGAYDVVAVFEAAGDEAMTAFSLSIAKLGNVKTQTLRAFSSKEMTGILEDDVTAGSAARGGRLRAVRGKIRLPLSASRRVRLQSPACP